MEDKRRIPKSAHVLRTLVIHRMCTVKVTRYDMHDTELCNRTGRYDKATTVTGTRREVEDRSSSVATQSDVLCCKSS